MDTFVFLTSGEQGLAFWQVSSLTWDIEHFPNEKNENNMNPLSNHITRGIFTKPIRLTRLGLVNHALLAAVTEENELFVFDLNMSSFLWPFRKVQAYQITSLGFMSDDRLLCIGTHEGEVKIFHTIEGRLLKTCNISCAPISHMCTAKDSSCIAVKLEGNKLGVIRHYDDNILTEELHASNFDITAIAFSPFHSSIVAVADEEGSLFVLDISSNSTETLMVVNFPSAHLSPISHILFSPTNSSLICSVGLDKRLCFFDFEKKKKRIRVFTLDDFCCSLQFLSSGSHLLLSTRNGNLELLDLRGGIQRKTSLSVGQKIDWIATVSRELFTLANETQQCHSVTGKTYKKQETPRKHFIAEDITNLNMMHQETADSPATNESMLTDQLLYSANHSPIVKSASEKGDEVSKENSNASKDAVVTTEDKEDMLSTTIKSHEEAMFHHISSSWQETPILQYSHNWTQSERANVQEQNDSIMASFTEMNPFDCLSESTSSENKANEKETNHPSHIGQVQTGVYSELLGAIEDIQHSHKLELKEHIQNLHVDLIKSFEEQGNEIQKLRDMLVDLAEQNNSSCTEKTSFVNYDERGLVIGSKRVLLLSGSIHYPRCHHESWKHLIRLAKEADFADCFSFTFTDVFWNQHEKERGVYDFSGNLNLFEFLRLVADEDLYALLRIGPYICAETSYGGFPYWLRDLPGIKFRTENEPFQREMSRWVRNLVQQLFAHGCFFTQGGPIIMVQFENEYKLIGNSYGEAGRNYLKWCSKLAQELELPVPLFMCKGSAESVLETINHFYGHQELETFFQDYPSQPAIWTECWTGWYDVWGSPHYIRPCKDLFYAVLRFFAQGGKGINYYMFYGGTNFDQLAMYLQTTSYDYDAPIDEYGRRTEKYFGLQRIHSELQRHFVSLALNVAKPVTKQYSEHAWMFLWTSNEMKCVFLCNDSREETERLHWNGQDYCLKPLSVQMIDSHGHVVLDSHSIFDSCTSKPISLSGNSPFPISFSKNWHWKMYKEQIPTMIDDTAIDYSVAESQPPEMLSLTGLSTDYCWYTIEYVLPPSALQATSMQWTDAVIEMEAADYVYVYIDSIYRCASPLPLLEERFPNSWTLNTSQGFRQQVEFSFDSSMFSSEKNTCSISLLVCSLGLIKGDWQLPKGWNMKDEQKGLLSTPKLSIKLPSSFHDSSEQLVTLPTAGAWKVEPLSMTPKLLWTSNSSWNGYGPQWYQTNISMDDDVFEQAPHGMLLDCKGLWKGRLWWNGYDLGRYWLIDGSISPIGFLKDSPILPTGINRETQRFYFIPKQSYISKMI
eukprot:jgi/Galph1/1707/GphlegSOOS_G389.1